MIPEKSEKDVADLEKKLKKLDAEKAVEEEKLKEVMESLKTETQVNESEIIGNIRCVWYDERKNLGEERQDGMLSQMMRMMMMMMMIHLEWKDKRTIDKLIKM